MSETVNQHSVFYVEGMCCADEQVIIEKKLRLLDGIEEYKFNLVARKLHVTHSLKPNILVAALREVGFTAKAFSLQPDLPQSFFRRHRAVIVTAIAYKGMRNTCPIPSADRQIPETAAAAATAVTIAARCLLKNDCGKSG